MSVPYVESHTLTQTSLRLNVYNRCYGRILRYCGDDKYDVLIEKTDTEISEVSSSRIRLIIQQDLIHTADTWLELFCRSMNQYEVIEEEKKEDVEDDDDDEKDKKKKKMKQYIVRMCNPLHFFYLRPHT